MDNKANLDPPGVETRARPALSAPEADRCPVCHEWWESHDLKFCVLKLYAEVLRLRALAVDPAVPGEPAPERT